ncbi:DUF4355 domain-containing protein [Clostridium botulinum]|nr:DUF4355 domain-containing protein [Clostridium botulinum]MBY6816462.1 DUF4355 domain-containing protein [Clostridium botulinum]MBY6827283.1 DUF4355 domain-containing protein [Clostridium botulinum]MBY6859231.1 DUF4355 domain-containing protein [Clostridium botulinum]
MDIKEIQEFLNTNKENEEVKDLIKSFQTPITREVVETWCQDGDGRSWLDRNCDIYSSKAVNTAREKAIAKFKEEELPNILKEKSNEDKTPEQVQLEELQKQIEQIKSEKFKSDMTTKFTKDLAEKGLPIDLINFALGKDEETTQKNIESLTGILNGYVTNTVDKNVKERLGQSADVPPKNNFNNKMTRDKFLGLSVLEQSKFAEENPSEYSEIMQ